MAAGTVILIVGALALFAVTTALTAVLLRRRGTPARRLGRDFSRLARRAGPRRARTWLAERRRVAELGIRPLSAEQRASYAARWMTAQERFIDSPAQAAREADALVTAVAADRGYPVDDHAQLLVDLSARHARHLDAYRRAHRAAERADAATEELRQALLGSRALFRELLGTPGGHGARRGPWRIAWPASLRATPGRLSRRPWRGPDRPARGGTGLARPGGAIAEADGPRG